MSWWSEITFKNPELLWLLLVVPAMIGWYVWRLQKDRAQLRFSHTGHLTDLPITLRQRLVHAPLVLRMLAFATLIVALARPQSSSSWQDITSEGIDIIISMDISGSMLAEDFKPNRLEASKKVALNFIEQRPNDRIGLVVFAGESFTQCPLTTDHSVIQNLFQEVKNGMIEDGTAIGMGLANGVKRLKDSEAISKVVILLTDGENNAGSIAPLTAAEIAKEFGIRVYTIGVGTIGTAPFPMTDVFGRKVYKDMEVRINEDLLTQVAEMTGGRYFRATDNASLKKVYEEIDQLEKSKIDVTEYRKRKEEFLPLVLIGLLLIGLEILLRNTLLRTLP